MVSKLYNPVSSGGTKPTGNITFYWLADWAHMHSNFVISHPYMVVLYLLLSKQVLIVKPGPDIPPPYDMTTDCVVPNHFLPPAKICADDDDPDISSETFEEQLV